MIILIIQFKCKIKQKTVILYENRGNFLRSERLQKIRIIVSFLLIFFSCKVIIMNVNKWKRKERNRKKRKG